MPRPGPVTRSMTRSGEVVLYSAAEQASIKSFTTRKDAIKKVTAPAHDSTTNKRPNFEPFNQSNPVSASTASSILPTEILTQNRMTILRLEQNGILAPGVVTIKPSGELCANLFIEPDVGTMAGLFPNITPSPDFDQQIPSWLRDYLLNILNVHGHGPPAVCRGFYNHLKDSQDDTGINHSVRTAESHLSYATISLRYAVQEVKSFAKMQYAFENTYGEEVWNVIKTIKRLVGYEGEKMPSEVRMLIELANMGTAMKEALNGPLRNLIITPYTKLLDKLELVSKALRLQLDRIDQEAEKVRENEEPRSAPDSGIYGCSC